MTAATEKMKNITTLTKTNGYQAAGLQDLIAKFEKVAGKLFPGCTVSHFYYGDHCDMADLFIGDDYAHFCIYATRVSLNGYTCSTNNTLKKFESMTLRDELYDGKLLQLAEA